MSQGYSGGSEAGKTVRTLMWGCVTIVALGMVCGTVIAASFWVAVPRVVDSVVRGFQGTVDGATPERPVLKLEFSPGGHLDVALAGGRGTSQSLSRSPDVTRFEVTTSDGGEVIAKVAGVFATPRDRHAELALDVDAAKPLLVAVGGLAGAAVTVDGEPVE